MNTIQCLNMHYFMFQIIREDCFTNLQTLIFEDCYNILRSSDLNDAAKISLFEPFESFGIAEARRIDEALRGPEKEVNISNMVMFMKFLRGKHWPTNVAPDMLNKPDTQDQETCISAAKGLDEFLMDPDLNLLDEAFLEALMEKTEKFTFGLMMTIVV